MGKGGVARAVPTCSARQQRFLFVTLVRGDLLAPPVRSLQAGSCSCCPPVSSSVPFRDGFSLPCCLSSRPAPPAGPFGTWQMGMNVTLAVSSPVPGTSHPAHKIISGHSRWGLCGEELSSHRPQLTGVTMSVGAEGAPHLSLSPRLASYETLLLWLLASTSLQPLLFSFALIVKGVVLSLACLLVCYLPTHLLPASPLRFLFPTVVLPGTNLRIPVPSWSTLHPLFFTLLSSCFVILFG
jgi:hypothetical protein